MKTQRAESLVNYLLISPPHLENTLFPKTVIFMFAHDKEGAMGLVLNRLLDSITLSAFFEEDTDDESTMLPVYEGGSEESERSFVLHMQKQDRTAQESNAATSGQTFHVTPTIDFHPHNNINAPHVLLTLGYTSWEPGQLEDEIQSNQWLLLEATPEFVFSVPAREKWDHAIQRLGIQPPCFASMGGHA